jgi:hypothetical protein
MELSLFSVQATMTSSSTAAVIIERNFCFIISVLLVNTAAKIQTFIETIYSLIEKNALLTEREWERVKPFELISVK